MIFLNADRLYAGYDEFMSACELMTALSSTASDVQNRISDISGMENAAGLLQRTNSDMYDLIERARRLCQCIDTVCQYYISCENRVQDYGENATVRFPHPSTTFVDLTATAGVLREFLFTTEGSDTLWQQANLK